MSRRHPCWKALGIEPTSDQRAIRSAYSARLKAIDPDTDPQAFIALREAFEAARIQAQWVDLPDEDEDWEEEDWEAGADSPPDYSNISPITGAAPAPTLAGGGFPQGHDPRRAPAAAEEPLVGFPEGNDPRRRPTPRDAAEEPLIGFPEGSDPRRTPVTPEAEEAPAAFPEGGDPRREPVRAAPWGPASAEDADAHARALAALLYAHNDGETYASTDQKEAILAHWRAITADPRMQEVAFFADADRWFSEMIARTTPFSDALIMPATRFFGWTRSDGTITQSWAAAQITRRYAAIAFMEAVEKPEHPLHRAWKELTRPAGEGSRRGRVDAAAVRRLLTTVRTHYPDLEGAFDSYRVGLWDGSTEGKGGWGLRGWSFAIVFAILVLARVLGNGDGPRTSLPPPVMSQPLEIAEADLDYALTQLFAGKLRRSRIATANPKLHQALLTYWRGEKAASVTRPEFVGDLRVFLNRWYLEGVRKGDAALLTDFHRLSIDMAKALQKRGAAECQRFLARTRMWPDAVDGHAEFAAREQALIVRALLATDGSDPGGERIRFTIPGAVVGAAAQRAGQTREQMQKTMMFEGPEAQQCSGRIAFMETVLALPVRVRLGPMRAM